MGKKGSESANSMVYKKVEIATVPPKSRQIELCLNSDSEYECGRGNIRLDVKPLFTLVV